MLLGLPYPKNVYLSLRGDAAAATFQVDASFPFFEGHFPGNPIVPAVTQIGWIVGAVESWRGAGLLAYRLTRFKFVIPIAPGAEVNVRLARTENKYVCRILADGVLCCSGILHVAK